MWNTFQTASWANSSFSWKLISMFNLHKLCRYISCSNCILVEVNFPLHILLTAVSANASLLQNLICISSFSGLAFVCLWNKLFVARFCPQHSVQVSKYISKKLNSMFTFQFWLENQQTLQYISDLLINTCLNKFRMIQINELIFMS